MGRRVVAAVALALVIAISLAGCQAVTKGSMTRTLAQSDVAAWTRQAVAATSEPPPSTITKLNAFDACRSDTAYFSTSFQWRTITNIDVPLARQAAATRAIASAFELRHWRAVSSAGLLTITGPTTSKLRGLITVQTAGSSQLAISVVSPCYT
jgi:hypothetical protein